MVTDRESPPRILVMGKRGGILQWPEHVFIACRKMNLDCRFLALNHQSSTDRFVKRAKGLVSKQWQDSHLAQQLGTLLQTFKPELLILPDLIALPEAVQAVLKQFKPQFKSAYWIGDFFPESIRHYNDFIDRFYFTDSHLQQQGCDLGLNRATYLPLAVDVSLFQPLAKPWQQRDHKVLFVGAYSENRYQMLRAIERPVQIYGKGWDKPMPSSHQVHSRNIPLADVARLYGSHRYVLNIINSNNIKHGLNMRCFETVSAGAVLITDRVADLPRCFNANDPVITYGDLAELNSILIKLDQHSIRGHSGPNTDALMKYDYTDRVLSMMRDNLGTRH
ncbi:MAG: glycosyltransferase [Ketobacter sp.]